MFDRFDEPSRHVMSTSRQIAIDLRQGAIGTEHILLALLDEGGVSARACMAAGATREAVHAEVEAATPPLDDPPTGGQLPFMPRSKRLLEKALDVVLELGHDHFTPAHLLVGLLRADRGLPSLHPRNNVSRRVMKRLKVDTASLEEQVLAELRALPRD